MSQQNKFLRNFDCFSDIKSAYVNSDLRENKYVKHKFWNKFNIIGTILSLSSILFLTLTFVLKNKIDFNFRFSFIGLGLLISFVTAFCSMVCFEKSSISKKLS